MKECHFFFSSKGGAPHFLKMSQVPDNFLQMDLFRPSRSDQAFKRAIFKSASVNVQVIVADPPWDSIYLAAHHNKNTYPLASPEELLALFRRLDCWFVPTAREQTGELYLWFTNDKFELALECLRAAGYQWVGLNSWHKRCVDGQPMKPSPMRGNAEFFLVGRKSWTNDFRMQASRGVMAEPYLKEHSSKPLEFYTQFLPFLAESRARGRIFGKPWSRVVKCDLFTRHAQEGFISVGNQFRGVRTSADDKEDISQFLQELEEITAPITERSKPLKKRERGEAPLPAGPLVSPIFLTRDGRLLEMQYLVVDIDLVFEDSQKRLKPTEITPGAFVDVYTKKKIHTAKVVQIRDGRVMVEWTNKRKGFAFQEWVAQDSLQLK